jgi:hypothetical protein
MAASARWLVASIASVAWLGSAHADDRSPTVSLGLTRGTGAETCITARELAQRVEARLGHPTFVSAAQADLFVDARIARVDRGWRASVAATRADGTKIGVRVLDSASADCRGLDGDLVLVVALVIDPNATDPGHAIPPPPTKTIYVAVPSPPPRWSFDSRIAAAVVGAVLPSPALALDAAIAATPPGAWPIELGAIVSREAGADDDGHGASLRLALGTVAVCPSLVRRVRSQLQLCVGGAVGALIVHAHGLDSGGDGDVVAADLLASARGRAHLVGPLDAVVDLGAMVPLTRRSLYYTALDPTTLQVVRHDVFDVPAVGWIASLGLALHFP